eukprot:SAG11_NODE_20718_length_439_cov_1.800000_1_plen_76_part_00
MLLPLLPLLPLRSLSTRRTLRLCLILHCLVWIKVSHKMGKVLRNLLIINWVAMLLHIPALYSGVQWRKLGPGSYH